ncbi:hypothetical protein BJY01DRAFT_135723 [Aspergillus pseudoustus]|uniref:Uncharacterized protein n=1 Tax=Aspergillus pseudoustus TaxID=1810923 RepID=A0ABR4IIV0_9EURO
MALALQCPVKRSNTGDAHLVAFLGPWAPGDSQRLLQDFQSSLGDVDLILWQPHPEAKDSQATIYALSIAAYRSGWSDLLIADGLSNRQVKGNTRGRESSLLSVIRVAVNGRQQDEVEVIARRTTTDSLGAILINADIAVRRGFEDGLVLHDSNQSLFTGDILSESAVGSPGLYDGTDPSIAGSVPRTDDSLNIFLLFPSPLDERRTIQSTIQQVVDQAQATSEGKTPTVHLAAWKHDRVPSRRDIYRLWIAYTQHVNRTDSMHFLESIPDAGISEAQFITIYDNEPYPLIVARNTLDTVVKASLGSSTRLSEIASTPFSQLREDIELLHDPDAPFAPNPFPWKSPDSRAIDIPLFYLTNALTLEQERALKFEIQTITDDDLEDELKACSFVPWNPVSNPVHGADGTIESIWNTIFELHTHKAQYPEAYIEPPYFFIDAQSGVDQTIIAVYTDKYSELSTIVSETEAHSLHDILADVMEPPASGFVYGRVRGRDAHNVYANVSVGEMDFEEFFEGREGELRRARGPMVPSALADFISTE